LSQNGVTPLHAAATVGNGGIAALLCRSKADINAQALDGFTPLHCCARSGGTEVVRLLLDQRAQLYEKCDKGQTPLDYALNPQYSNDATRALLKAAVLGPSGKAVDARLPSVNEASADSAKESSDLRSCTACGANLKQAQRCSRCKKVFYCDSACQRKHWPKHKATCQVVAPPAASAQSEPTAPVQDEDSIPKQPQQTENTPRQEPQNGDEEGEEDEERKDDEHEEDEGKRDKPVE